MKLTDILTPECIKLPLASTAKEEVITELVDLLAQAGRISDREQVRDAVLAREATASTGIGHGLAVPHGKTSACETLVLAIGLPAEPIDFASRDGKPVDVVALLVSPSDQTGPHIQALAQISRIMLVDSFRSVLAKASTSQEVYDLIATAQR